MIIVIGVLAVVGFIWFFSIDDDGPGALCKNCGGRGWTETHGYGGYISQCTNPNGRHR